MADGDKRWDGIRNDLSSVGDGIETGSGISFSIEGEIRRRPGLTWLADFGGQLVQSFRSPITGAFAVIVTSSGTIEAVAL